MDDQHAPAKSTVEARADHLFCSRSSAIRPLTEVVSIAIVAAAQHGGNLRNGKGVHLSAGGRRRPV